MRTTGHGEPESGGSSRQKDRRPGKLRFSALTLLYDILPPTGNTRGPSALDALLQTLTIELKRDESVELQLRGDSGHSGLAIQVPSQHRPWLWDELLDAYPGTVLKKRLVEKPSDFKMVAYLALSTDLFSIRLADDFTDDRLGKERNDPLAGLLSRLKTGRDGRLRVCVGLTLARPPPRMERRFKRHSRLIQSIDDENERRATAKRLAQTGWLRRVLIEHALKRRRVRTNSPQEEGKADGPLLHCQLSIHVSGPRDAQAVIRRKATTIAAAYERFGTRETSLVVSQKPRPFILTPREISSIWHLPTISTDSVSRVKRNEFFELPPPEFDPKQPGDVVLGRVVYRGQKDHVVLKEDDLRRHLFVLGRTGSGKSVLLGNIARQRIADRRGCVVVDPHGELVESIRKSIKGHRKNDVIMLDASDLNGKVFYNPLIGPAGADVGLVADGVLTAFQQTFGLDAASAPRLLHILRSSLLTLIGQPGVTLASINRLLTDDLYRKSMVGHCSNKAVVAFWTDEFARWNSRERPLIIASLQNKLGPFTTSERLQHILCTPTNKAINFRDLMDRQKVLLVNLSKGQTGQDTSKLLGSLLLSGLHLAAMSRADVPEQDRPDCTVIVDEIASYLSDENTTIAESLAELRKYRVSYVLASQLLQGQLDEATRTAVLGNVGSLIAMTIGPTDADLVAPLIGEPVEPKHLVATPRFHTYGRLLVNGSPHSLSMRTEHTGNRRT